MNGKKLKFGLTFRLERSESVNPAATVRKPFAVVREETAATAVIW